MFCLAKYYHVGTGVGKSSFNQSGVPSCENVLCGSQLFSTAFFPHHSVNPSLRQDVLRIANPEVCLKEATKMALEVLSNYLGMTRTVLLVLKSGQLIANQI